MADYAGSRRAAPPLSELERQRAFAEDDAADPALVCPQCGSFVRSDQQWCTLCLHVLHAPEPDPEPEPAPAPTPVAVVAPVAPDSTEPSAPTAGAAPTADPTPAASGLSPEAEAAAAALLEQLAYETRREGFQVPSYLESKGQKAVAVCVVMTVLSGIVLALMGLLGMLFH